MTPKSVELLPTLSHKLILPSDANHHGMLYAGSLLRIALEAGYAAAWKHIGVDANIVLRRVLNIECLRPVPVGTVIEIQGLPLYQTQAYLVIGMIGSPIQKDQGLWMEALMGFAQVNEDGKAALFPRESDSLRTPSHEPWSRLHQRLQKLLKIR